MTRKQISQAAKPFGGWFEEGVLYFPSVDLRRQFECKISRRHGSIQ